MTGMREASWIIPDECEVVSLPRFNRLRRPRAGFSPKFNWLDHNDPLAPTLRRELMLSTARAFAPDALVVDYLPFGKWNELLPLLGATNARKYFILRGIVDTSDHSHLCGEAARRIGEAYDRILVTADPLIVDVSQECAFDRLTESKVTYVGYVMPEAVDQQAVRSDYNVPNGSPWVVCSGGGGIFAEGLLNRCRLLERVSNGLGLP
jgi:predicted glycosyltransferase